ncbi:PIN2/TERF1-interacting telomerase inhibitor 1 [Tetrabaena socialis]|uniref:PIN2/TERF1-interacting telomerase inhibitor 1 n=1 Tax=Tetrabaena socialis TaxID=47790 RepID=A0A2J7ZWY9_9CHLO|nr:PIN2/TERF1-interacting telomerase inhibitor 1 [Tetrabaena socialis]|eukprot:PNH04765.1 PIN2/TERF1-interacting telomerase inhibitor 1 [Tetrabaena socialis]
MKLPPGYVAGTGLHKASGFGGLGQRLMEGMGWAKGQGLGKDKDGMKEALEVKKKEDTLGVGANTSGNWAQRHWEDAYDNAVQNINHAASSSSSSSSDSDSDSDGGARRGRGARAKRGGPASAAGRGSAVVTNRDGTVASASAAELKIAADLAKDPWGRWGGRGGKMARIRAQEQEEASRARAKLGLAPLPAAPATPMSDSSSSSDSDSDSEEGSRGGRGAADGPSTSGRGGRQVGGEGAAAKQGPEGRGKKRRKEDATQIRRSGSRLAIDGKFLVEAAE